MAVYCRPSGTGSVRVLAPGRSLGIPVASTPRPDPPTNARRLPRSNAASTLGDALRRDRGEQTARRLRIVGEGDEVGRHAVRDRRAHPATKRRLCAAPPVSTPAAARSSAPGSAGSAAASKTNRVPDARAISRPWPSRPKPGHVRGGPDAGRRRAPPRPRRSGARIPSIAVARSAVAASGPGDARDTRMPVPSRFVSTSRSPGRAPPLRISLSGWAAPMTARPYLGSGSRIVWPPASVPPASRTFAEAPAKIAAQHVARQLLGERRDRQREQDAAAHREHVRQRVRGGDLAERPRVVDERREEVERADDREVVG